MATEENVSIMPVDATMSFEATSMSYGNLIAEDLVLSIVFVLSNAFDKLAFASKITALKDI